jgi:predicted aspartyl protease
MLQRKFLTRVVKGLTEAKINDTKENMGETVVNLKISSLKDLHWEVVEVLADTEATYTTLPHKVLQQLGIEQTEKIHIKFANGEVEEKYIGNVLIELEGRIRANPVIFGEKNDALVLGLITLESYGLTVDTINKKLVPLPEIHHY